MNHRLLLGPAAAIAVAACAPTRAVSSGPTPGANPAAYKSFTFINPAPTTDSNPLTYERVRQGVEAALTSKGYARSDPAELSVIITLGKRDKADVVTQGWWAPTNVYHYKEGEVSVDIFNTNTRQPVWHGQATQAINPHGADPATINAAVTSVMAQFPARS